jgi:Domain of unknown function (DUF4180)
MRLFEVPSDGPPVRTDRDAVAIIGDAFSARPDWIVLPVDRLGDGVLDLKTRQLGEILQKFVNYGFRVALVGDVSQVVAASKPFADFVRETNRGNQIWFVPDRAALLERLGGG